MTNEEFVAKLKEINPNIEPLEPFKSAHHSIKYRCKKHDVVSQIRPFCLLNGSGCKLCGYEKVQEKNNKAAEAWKEKIQEANPYVEVLEILPSTYGGKRKDRYARVRCLLCGEETCMRIRVLMMGSSCVKCRGKRISQKCQSKLKTTQQFQEEVSKIHPNIKILGEYTGSHDKIKYLCTECGCEHSATPTNLLSGYGCPTCNSSSKGEGEIEDILIRNGINYEKQKWFDDCRDILPLRFDFYLVDYDILVEFQGEQHYRVGYCFGSTKEEAEHSFEVLTKHDEIKRNYCKQTGHTELEICYLDIKRCEEIILEAIEKKKKEVMPS